MNHGLKEIMLQHQLQLETDKPTIATQPVKESSTKSLA